MSSRPTTRETPSSWRWNSSWARNVPTNFGLESERSSHNVTCKWTCICSGIIL